MLAQAAEAFAISGTNMTLSARLQDPAGGWTGTILARDDVGEVAVTITAQREIYVEGQLVHPEDVLAAFLGIHKQSHSRTVLIRADRGVDYGLVFHVMDAARLANLTDVALAAEPTRTLEYQP